MFKDLIDKFKKDHAPAPHPGFSQFLLGVFIKAKTEKDFLNLLEEHVRLRLEGCQPDVYLVYPPETVILAKESSPRYRSMFQWYVIGGEFESEDSHFDKGYILVQLPDGITIKRFDFEYYSNTFYLGD